MRNMEENTVIAEEKKIKEPKTPKQKAFFVLKIVGNVIFYAILLLLFLWSIMNINGGARNQGFPNIFGKGFLNVLTPSMSHENMVNDIYTQYPEYKNYEIQGINVGDLVIVSVLDDSDRQNLKAGDVCTFYDSNLNALNTHRIIEVTKDSAGKITKIIFQGDKSVASYGKYDTLSNQEKLILQEKSEVQVFGEDLSGIKGLVTSVKAGAGKVLKNLQDNWLWYFVFPVIILLLIEVFLVVRNIMILRGEKNKIALEADKDTMLADEKERLRQELLAEMRAQGLVPPAETNNEAPAVAAAATEEPQVEEKAEEPIEAVEEAKTEETTELNSEENKNEEVVEETPAQEETPVEEKTEEVEPQTEEVTETKEEPQVEEKVEEPEVKEEVVEEVKEEATPQEETPAVEEANENKETVEEKVEEVKPKRTRKTTKKTEE